MGKGHTLGRIRDQIPGHEGILHPHMPHGDTVTNRDRRKYDRSSSCHRHAKFHCFYYFINIHVPWHNLIIGADDTHQRLLQFLFCHSQCIEQGTLWCSLHPLLY